DPDLHAGGRESPAQFIPAAGRQWLLLAHGQGAHGLPAWPVRTVDAQLAGLPFPVEDYHAAAAGTEPDVVLRRPRRNNDLNGAAIGPLGGGGLAGAEVDEGVRNHPGVAEQQVSPGLVQDRVLSPQ